MAKSRPLAALTRMRVLLFMREPEALFWVFGFPLVMALVLGFAFREEVVEPSRIGVFDRHAAEWQVALEGSAELLVVPIGDEAEGEVALRHAEIDALVEGPPAAAASPSDGSALAGSAGALPELFALSTRPEAELAKLRLSQALAPGDQSPSFVGKPASERGARYLDFLFPGLLGMNLMGTGLWGIGFGLADFRQKKLIERLLVTPMHQGTFLASFVTSRGVFLVAEVAVLLGFAIWVLEVPQRGSWLAVSLTLLFAALAFSGLGLLVASRARTIEGVSGLMNLVMMPMWLGSGVFFSIERFPEWLVPWLRWLPLTACNDALRSLMLDGASLAEQAFELAVMGAWSVASFLLALKIFRWR